MVIGLFEGQVLKVYAKERKGKGDGQGATSVPMFDLYEKQGGQLMHVEGNGVKEGESFKGLIGVDLLTGTSSGRAYAFLTCKKVDVSASGRPAAGK